MSRSRSLSPAARYEFYGDRAPERKHTLTGPQGDREVFIGDELWDTVERRRLAYEETTGACTLSDREAASLNQQVTPVLGHIAFAYSFESLPEGALEYDCS